MSKDKCFWADNPTRLWIYIEEDRLHQAPWGVIVGGSKRASFKTKLKAIELVLALSQTFEEHTSNE